MRLTPVWMAVLAFVVVAAAGPQAAAKAAAKPKAQATAHGVEFMPDLNGASLQFTLPAGWKSKSTDDVEHITAPTRGDEVTLQILKTTGSLEDEAYSYIQRYDAPMVKAGRTVRVDGHDGQYWTAVADTGDGMMFITLLTIRLNANHIAFCEALLRRTDDKTKAARDKTGARYAEADKLLAGVRAIVPYDMSDAWAHGTWFLFFDRDVTDMTAAAQSIADKAAADCTGPFLAAPGKARTVAFEIVGHTDTAEANPKQAGLKRAQAVRDEMIAKGCRAESISVRSAGATDMLEPTGPGVSEPQNRRAVIRETATGPMDAFGFYLRGRASGATYEFKSAVDDYDQAIALDAQYDSAYVGRGEAYDGLDDYDRAIGDFNRAIALNANYADAYCGRGTAYLAKRDYDRALADAETCSAHYGSDGAALRQKIVDARAKASAAAAAAAMPAMAGLITHPAWVATPDADLLARNYPPEALRTNLEGHVVAECAVQADGALSGCSIVSEDPPGAGFGPATLRVTTAFRMAPKTVNGKPVAGARVRIPIHWTTGD